VSDIQYEYWDERRKERHSEREATNWRATEGSTDRSQSKLASGNELCELRQE
jgi:hypothetical protein